MHGVGIPKRITRVALDRAMSQDFLRGTLRTLERFEGSEHMRVSISLWP